MPNPSKQTIIDAIIKGIEIGKDRGNLLATVGKKWQISQRTFDRYWKTAQEQHIEKQGAIKSKLVDIDTNAAIEARKKAIMTAMDRKEYLTKLISGEIKVNQPFVIAGEITEYPSAPSHSDRIRAIAELNKMEGDYAPTKVANTDGSGNDISPIINIQVVNPIED